MWIFCTRTVKVQNLYMDGQLNYPEVQYKLFIKWFSGTINFDGVENSNLWR